MSVTIAPSVSRTLCQEYYALNLRTSGTEPRSMHDHFQIVTSMPLNYFLHGLVFLLISLACMPAHAEERSMWVKASAYNSLPDQTEGDPTRGAWGDKLAPGMKAIAVSPDLIEEHGIRRGTKVRIDGLEGEYTVLDKMPDDWYHKIDIYMGTDVQRARRWGVKKVRIRW